MRVRYTSWLTMSAQSICNACKAGRHEDCNIMVCNCDCTDTIKTVNHSTIQSTENAHETN